MFTRSMLVLAALVILPEAVTAQGAPPRPPRVPRPAPVAAPMPVPAPSPVLAPAAPRSPWSALDMHDMAQAHSELARASAEMAMHSGALRAASAEMASNVARDLARLHASDLAQIAVDGRAIAAAVAPMAQTFGADAARAWTSGYRTVPPEAWDAQDPADSLYREARKALAAESYQRAAELFRAIRQRYVRSSYASDAPYWEAFALHRLGGETNLRLAQDALGLQQRDYPTAATRGDAAALNARIESQLARRGDTRMASTIVGRAQRAANDDGCPRAEEDERIEALNAVAQMDAAQAMPILKKVLARREPCTQALRRTAVWLVARQKQPEAASLLMNAAKTDPDREVREQAVFWLANVPGDEALEMLIGLARGNEELELRKRAVYALSRSNGEKARTTLREIAADARMPDELRMEAFGWYLRSAKPSNADPLPFLKSMYASVSSDALKQTVMRNVAGVRGEEARSFLIGVAMNERESLDVRRSAILFLERLGGVAVVTRPARDRDSTPNTSATRSAEFAAIARSLWQVYEKTNELELRRQVLSSLARVGDNAGIDRLIDVARNEKNPELRRSAVSFLSRSKDPRALALLQEIIDK